MRVSESVCVCIRLYEEEGESVRVSLRFALQKGKKERGEKRLDVFFFFFPKLLFFFRNERRDVRFILRNDIHGFIL